MIRQPAQTTSQTSMQIARKIDHWTVSCYRSLHIIKDGNGGSKKHPPVFTGLEKFHFDLDDLTLIPQIVHRVLIWALEHGLKAQDALKSQAFHGIGQKLEAMNKLNEAIKADQAINKEKHSKGEPIDI